MHKRSSPSPKTGRPSAPYRVVHDPDGPATLSTTVVHALADCMGVDPTDGRITLYDIVDPDALDSLFRPQYDGTPRAGGRVSFVVDDYRVTIDGGREVVIEPPTNGPAASTGHRSTPTRTDRR